jgi:hypothetical protein
MDMTRRPQRVHVTIDRLVLRGFPPDQRDVIAAGLTRELIDLLTAPGRRALGTSRSVARLQPKRFATTPASTPGDVGAAAARSIVKGVGQ